MSSSAPGWLIGTLRGVPIYIGRSWPVIALIVVVTFGPLVRNAYPDLGNQSYIVALLYALLLLVSVLVHEAAHALVGQWRGYQVRQVVADLWGGHTAYDSDDSSPLSSALVAIVGPLANAVLALVGYGLLQVTDDGVPRLLVYAFTFSNAFVAAFNMLPGLPLDGGFLVDALVWQLTGSRHKGLLVAGWCGRLVAVIVVAWVVVRPLLAGDEPNAFYVLWTVLIGGFLWMGAGNAISRAKAGLLFAQVRVRDVIRPAAVAPDRTPLTELLSNADTVVLDSAGRPWGLVPAAQLQSVPPTATAPASALAQVQPQGWVAPVGSLDDDATPLIQAAQNAGPDVRELFVVSGNQALGLVSIQTLGDALGAADRVRRPSA